MEELSKREIELIEEMGLLKAVLSVKELLLQVLVVRLGGEVKLTKDEIEYSKKTYSFEHNIRTDDQTLDVILRARLQ